MFENIHRKYQIPPVILLKNEKIPAAATGQSQQLIRAANREFSMFVQNIATISSRHAWTD